MEKTAKIYVAGHRGLVGSALVRTLQAAKLAGQQQVVVWGTGTPIREFLHVDDLAAACLFLMERYSGNEIVNIGCGYGLTIGELAEMVKEVVGFTGNIIFDADKPDGTPVKLLDIGRLERLGWQPSIALREGITATYQWYLEAAQES
jgi:GDP-L-fucose synthase